MLGLTRELAFFGGHQGININAILPGGVATDMIAEAMNDPTNPAVQLIKASLLNVLQNLLKLQELRYSLQVMMQVISTVRQLPLTADLRLCKKSHGLTSIVNYFSLGVMFSATVYF
jgi:NAD(P)-dependent dehydrogenase (short-subunit alcohol dehydrogenase family)